jgi:cysteine desulfurase family protein (TIGR01976 family)
MSTFPIDAVRAQFPALLRQHGGKPVVYFDGPAGSQVPRSVVEAISSYLLEHNANHGGVFATSVENDEMLIEAQRAAADLLGASDPQSIVFGANMTTMTFAFSRAMAQSWRAGDEIVVTDLDHDANVTSWAMAARERDVTVRRVRVKPDECTLDLEDFQRKLSARTRLVAVGCASNAVGTINPLRTMIELAHAAGAEVFLDAVHYAPHALIDVQAWECDFLVCSTYKFFGPHAGILWGRRDRLEELKPFKVRPSSNDCPDRWMTGTPNFECIAGARAAIDYLASLGIGSDRRAKLRSAFERIVAYERELCRKALAGLASVPGVRVLGITNESRLAERVPTISIVHAKHDPMVVAEHLAKHGIFVWNGNMYALSLSETLGLEPAGMVRVGLLHYNTANEIDRLIESLKALN